jgi:DNA polymerase III gamma/tau subunit
MRNLLIARVCGADSDLIAATPDQRPGFAKAAALFSEEDLTRYFQILLQTDDSLRRTMDPRVHLEMGMLRLVNAARLAPLEELLAEVSGGSSGRASGGSAPRSAAPGAATSSFPARSASAGASATTEAKPIERAAASAFASSSAATAAAPAQVRVPAPPSQTAPAPAAERTTEIVASGLSKEQVMEIKAAIQTQQKFVAELLEQASRWEWDGGERRIYFPPDKSAFAGLIEGRETLEKIRASSSKVLGRAVRVCARLETVAANGASAAEAASLAASGTQEMRAQFENDPMVKSMLQRFGGRISEVRRRNGE